MTMATEGPPVDAIHVCAYLSTGDSLGMCRATDLSALTVDDTTPAFLLYRPAPMASKTDATYPSLGSSGFSGGPVRRSARVLECVRMPSSQCVAAAFGPLTLGGLASPFIHSMNVPGWRDRSVSPSPLPKPKLVSMDLPSSSSGVFGASGSWRNPNGSSSSSAPRSGFSGGPFSPGIFVGELVHIGSSFMSIRERPAGSTSAGRWSRAFFMDAVMREVMGAGSESMDPPLSMTPLKTSGVLERLGFNAWTTLGMIGGSSPTVRS